MDNSKSIKFNFRKMLLETTTLVVIGAFCISTAFVDLVWAYSGSQANSFLRVVSIKENPKKVIALKEELAIRQRLLEYTKRFELKAEEIKELEEAAKFYLELREQGKGFNEAIGKVRNRVEQKKLIIVCEQIIRGHEGGLGVASFKSQSEEINPLTAKNSEEERKGEIPGEGVDDEIEVNARKKIKELKKLEKRGILKREAENEIQANVKKILENKAKKMKLRYPVVEIIVDNYPLSYTKPESGKYYFNKEEGGWVIYVCWDKSPFRVFYHEIGHIKQVEKDLVKRKIDFMQLKQEEIDKAIDRASDFEFKADLYQYKILRKIIDGIEALKSKTEETATMFEVEKGISEKGVKKIKELNKGRYKAFKSSMTELKRIAEKEYVANAQVLEKVAAKHEFFAPQTLILYSELLLKYGGVIDFQDGLEILLKNNALEKVILYAEDPVYNEILEKLIKKVKEDIKPDLKVEKVTKEELELEDNVTEVKEIEALIREKENIFCIIKGITEEREALKDLSKERGIPIVVFEKNPVSFTETLQRSLTAQKGIIDIPSIKTKNIQKEYEEYKRALRELSGA